MRERYPPIEDHGVIGDLHTVALVGKDGAIDFLCAPRFDSPSVFAALLDADGGGCFRIDPRLEPARQRQIYLPDTNLLLTRTLSPDGVAELSDFMPIGETPGVRRIVRRAKAVRAEVGFDLRCAPRFGYAQVGHRATEDEHGIVFVPDDPARAGLAWLRLHSSVPLRLQDGDALAEFRLGPEETATFILEAAAEAHETVPASREYAAEAFKRTANFWRSWIGRSTYRGRWRDEVHRSA